MNPLFSVVIPTCHRNDLLAKCLDCLAPGKQTLFFDQYEVIIADDGIKTTAQQLVKEKYSWAKWVQGPQRGPAANRNKGAQCTKGSWLIFVDDDCLPNPMWLENIAEVINKYDIDVIEGKTICPDKKDNPLFYYVENLTGGAYWSCNLAIKKDIFFKIGAFDEDFLEAGGDDLELAYRIKKNNLQTLFCPNAIVYHPVRVMNWRGLLWRAYLDRWISLYNLKIGASPALSSNSIYIIRSFIANRIAILTRFTWSYFKKYDHLMWRSRLFYLFWKWFTFPILFPCMLFWEFRFRQRLSKRTN